jgi:aspartate beta-hydroxylase
MTDGAQSISELLKEAATARQTGDLATEIAVLDKALQFDPANPHVLNARGMAALNAGDTATARTKFEAAAAIDPGERALWMNVATACRALHDIVGERMALERVLDIDRLDFMGQLRLAELHDRTGNMVDAVLGWTHVVQLAAQIEPRPPIVAEALARGRAILAAHNEQTAAKIDIALSAKIATLGAAGRRFQACVDHGLGRRAIYQNECAGVFYPFLPADEFFDRDQFPWFAELEAKTDAIRAEALALFANGGAAIRPYVRMEKGGPDTIWSGLDGSLDWSACFLWEYGVRNDAVCAICPETAAALERLPQNHIPGKAPSAFFSLLKPGAHIPPHTGVTNTRAIIHLPLVVPEGCRFRVGGETRIWREGEAFAFDDTIQHEAWNDSAEARIVLIFDVWNPHLSVEEQMLLSEYFALTGARSVSA